MSIPLWLFLLVTAWAVVSSIFLFFRNPLPVPDRGHRCFAVPDERAARLVATILERIGRLPERFTFDVGPTHQTLLWDNTTVIIYFDDAAQTLGLASNGLSLPVRDPRASAEEAKLILERDGYFGSIRADLDPEKPDNLVLLKSDAFDGWVLVFRKHVLAMGKPHTRRLGTA